MEMNHTNLAKHINHNETKLKNPMWAYYVMHTISIYNTYLE